MNPSYIVLARQLDNKYRPVHHVLFIGFIFIFWFLFSRSIENYAKYLLYSLTYVFVSYFNIYFLFRRYFLNGKTGRYILASLVTFVISYVAQQFIYFKSWAVFKENFTPGFSLLQDILTNAITYCMFIGIGLSAKMIKMWLSSQLRVTSLEEENLKAKLANLKSQVSPHFLFNTFNNLYVLTKTQPLVAAEMILGFSDLMRYQLNESENEKVAIEKEINYIENFLTLEKLRKDTLDIKIEYDGPAIAGICVEPLLFVVLIENAVKHGSQQMENAFIHVHMQRNNGHFSFRVVNSKPKVSTLGKEKSLGKGIDNLKKRLDLSYPAAYKLELNNQGTEFTATLQIDLT